MKYDLYRLIAKWLLKELRRMRREELAHSKTKQKPKLANPSDCVVQGEPIADTRISASGANAYVENFVAPNAAEPAQLEPFPQTFVIESFFARELITILTRGANEEMHFLTGPKIGPIRIVSRWARPPSLERQSPVFVRATARSVADVLIPIIEQGAELHICAHSHPGGGAGATTPSGTDIQCLGKLQKSGSLAIGCIVTRDGHLRFFSVSTNFHAMVLGSGVKEITKNVFHVAPQSRY